jgi:hypothetical protein
MAPIEICSRLFGDLATVVLVSLAGRIDTGADRAQFLPISIRKYYEGPPSANMPLLSPHFRLENG